MGMFSHYSILSPASPAPELRSLRLLIADAGMPAIGRATEGSRTRQLERLARSCRPSALFLLTCPHDIETRRFPLVHVITFVPTTAPPVAPTSIDSRAALPASASATLGPALRQLSLTRGPVLSV